jgi:hypothetical protein
MPSVSFATRFSLSNEHKCSLNGRKLPDARRHFRTPVHARRLLLRSFCHLLRRMRLFCALNRHCSVRTLEARALLKILFAVADAVFISKSNFAFPSDAVRMARERVDTNGSTVISFSRLWNYFRCA